MLPYPSFRSPTPPSTPASFQVRVDAPPTSVLDGAVFAAFLDVCRGVLTAGMLLAPASMPRAEWRTDGPSVQAEG